MITVLTYIALQTTFGSAWSGWLLVLPVITDLVLLDRIDKR
jgi:hypothetical protein